jgi:Methyltransferase domain
MNNIWKQIKNAVRDQIQAARSRPGRLYALWVAPRGGVCAEIGIWAGGYSERILKLRRPRELHLIDPWLFVPSLPERMYGGAVARDQCYMDNLMRSVVERFSAHPEVRIHRKTSVEAATEFRKGHFDWIYIDGDHSFESVLADLNAWFPKLKAGGTIICDDYTWMDEARTYSVKRAVEAFMHANPAHAGRLVFGQFLIRKA